MMCRADIRITGRGLQNLWEHWKGAEHTRLEQKFRMMTQRPLLDKSCCPVTAEEEQRIKLERMTELPVYLEPALSLTLEQRMALEQESETEANRPTLSSESSS